MESWLSTKEVAAALGISQTAVNRLCDRGTLAFRFVAGRKIVSSRVLDNYVMDEAAQARRRNMKELEDAGQQVIELDPPAKEVTES